MLRVLWHRAVVPVIGGGIEIQHFHEAARAHAGFEKFIGCEWTKSLLVCLKGRHTAKAQLNMGKRFVAPAQKVRGLAQRNHDQNRNGALDFQRRSEKPKSLGLALT